MEYECYTHHGVNVIVRVDLKGKHREYCLCYACQLFTPEDRERNCKIASLLYAVDVALGVTTPVWECPKFILRESDE